MIQTLDLQTLANLAEIFGGLVVIGGGFFGLTQLIEFRKQRRNAVASELMRAFYDPYLANALHLIHQVDRGISAKELRAKGSEYEQAAMLICTMFETSGLLVYQNIASFSMVRELSGGIMVVCFDKLKLWLDDVRREQDQPSFGEWFQWIAERMQEHAKDKNAKPAHVEHARWRPRS